MHRRLTLSLPSGDTWKQIITSQGVKDDGDMEATQRNNPPWPLRGTGSRLKSTPASMLPPHSRGQTEVSPAARPHFSPPSVCPTPTTGKFQRLQYPPSQVFPSGNFKLNYMELPTVNHFLPKNGSFMWFNSTRLCWPLWPSIWGGDQGGICIRAGKKTVPFGLLSLHLPDHLPLLLLLTPEGQYLPPSASIRCYFFILRAHHSQFQFATS